MTAPIYASVTIHQLSAGKQHDVQLNGIVSQCCVGLAGIWFDYGDDDNNIFDMSLSASIVGKTVNSQAGTSVVTLRLDGKMEDDAKNTGSVTAQVVLIAVFEGTLYTPTLATTASFNSGSSSTPISIPSSPSPSNLQCMLSSFAMGYSGSNDQGVNQISAAVDIASDNGSGSITLGGTCVLAESTKTKADELTLAGSLLADSNTPSLFEIISFSVTSSDASVMFSQEVTSAQAVLTSFNAQYDGSDDHKVKKLVVSYSYFWVEGVGLQPDGRTFNLKGSAPVLEDDSDNHQGSASYANYLVIGAVKQPDPGT